MTDTIKKEEEESNLGYTDYTLVSSLPPQTTGWQHHLLRFASHETQDPLEWSKPLKLNRKDPRTVRRLADAEREKINKLAWNSSSMEVDSKPATEADEKGKGKGEVEEIDLTLVGAGVSGDTGRTAAQRAGQTGDRKGMFFKKKTKRVFVAAEESRKLRREEWAPWVLEDNSGDQRWIGQLAGDAGTTSVERGEGSAYVAFVLGESGSDFQVVPLGRWYKFSRGPRHATLDAEEAETEYNRQQKNADDSRWMMHKRAAVNATASTSKDEIRDRLLVKSGPVKQKADASRPRLRSVIANAPDTRGGDDGNPSASRARQVGQDQEDGEFDFEEEFEDDEEGQAMIDDMADEEEAKQLEERIRREMRGAERADEVNDEEGKDDLTGAGKETRKLVRKSDKAGLYESDAEDDLNPYLSDEERSDDDARSIASLDLNGDSSRRRSTSATPRPRSQSTKPPHSRQGSTSTFRVGSRSNSPAPTASGSALVAKRATSPSPSSSGGKRKRREDETDSAKRKKASSSGGTLLTAAMLIELFKARGDLTTSEVLAHFKKEIKAEPKNKAAILPLLPSVASLSDGKLVLKPGL